MATHGVGVAQIAQNTKTIFGPTNLVVDGRVASDDGDHREEEAEEEQKLLGRGAVVLEDGAGEGGGV